MKGILDDSRLNGVFDVGTALRPLRRAELVPAGDLDMFLQRVEFNCQVWGGGGTVFVPSTNGSPSEPYRIQLIRSDIDVLDTEMLGDDIEAPYGIDRGTGWTHAALLIADGMDREGWFPFRVAELAPDDPWKPIYAAILGLWPDTPAQSLFPEPFFDAPPESFEMFFEVERVEVTGSLDDLVDRLTGRNSNWPRKLTLLGLASGMLPNTGYIAANRVIPQSDETRTAAGPNIIAVFGNDPVADAALLWNLRAAHTDRYALPIGIPRSHVDADALGQLRRPGRMALFGLGGGQTFITSASVAFDQLAAIAALHSGHTAVTHDKLLAFGRAPSIPRNQLATFTDGIARLVPETDADRKLIYPHGRQSRGPEMHLEVIVDGHPVPTSPTLRGERMWAPRFAAGYAQIQVPGQSSRRARSVEVEWPTPWLRLQCVARDHDLDVDVSPSGHAALALIAALGGVDQIRWLTHQRLVDLLYRLAERSGMAWWKTRWTSAHREIEALGIDEESFEELAEKLGRDEPPVAPPGEGRELPFQEFVKALGNEKAATNWIRWAERRHLVVRGAEVRCDMCTARSWLPMAAMPAAVTCPGCGRTIEHPFPPRQLPFRYRLGEVLRRVLEVDCLDHLFALRYFHTLLERQGLVGAHPGVNFMERGSPEVGAEADVLLLFADGSLVPGEIKRTGAGVTVGATTKLDTVMDRLRAPWSFFAVGQPARDCGPNVPAAESRAADRRRFVVTTDQVYERYPIWSIGADPFAWSPRSQSDDQTRAEQFVAHLRDRSPDEPWSSQGSSLLTVRESPD